VCPWDIRPVDPCGQDALDLLRLAAMEARDLYPELHKPEDPWPVNVPASTGDVYLVAYRDAKPVGCGALSRLNRQTAEVRRVYVTQSERRRGLARAILGALENQALTLGYRLLRLETGRRQLAAMALYRASGFTSIAAFGPYVGDPVSRCFEKYLADDS
jgi:putative acetyltransferase